VRPGDRAVAGQVHPGWPAEVDLLVLCRLRDVHEHRSGASGGRDVEGLGHPLRDLGAVLDEEGVLDDRHGRTDDVRLLEGVGPDEGGVDLAGDRHQGNRVHVGVGDRGGQVRGTGTRGDHGDPDASRDARVPLGRVPGALFVADQDVADLLGVEERVVDRQDRAAKESEHGVRAELLE